MRPNTSSLGAQAALSQETSSRPGAFASRGAIATLQLFAMVVPQMILLEPTRAADRGPDECGLASVYSSLSEETASGEDTIAKNLTAAHRTLPFGTLLQVDNRENGRSAFVRITDRGPFVSGRIIDVSQSAAHELGMSGLAKVCLKILASPERQPVEIK